jgi:dTDP-glucose 4,6-dehydratase
MIRTLLVTGGAGFIGGNYVLRSLSQDDGLRIVNLDLLTYAGNCDTLRTLKDDERHTFVQGDIADAGLVAELLSEHSPDAIVNFAAESHVDRSIDGPAAFVQTNVVGTLNVLQCTLDWWRSLPETRRSAFRFLHISTDEVYGSLEETGAFLESTAYAPNSPYAASKASSDHLVRAFNHTYGMPTLTTNCSNNYGPYQFPEKLIPLIILNALELKPLPVYGDGLQVRDWLFVHDHVDAINCVLAQGKTGEVYNVGGLSERTNMQVVHAICDAIDKRRPEPSFGSRSQLIKHVADRPGHDRRYAIDCSKLMNRTDWRPSVDFDTGLQRTVDWYLENDTWVERVRDGSYQGQRLGLRGEN